VCERRIVWIKKKKDKSKTTVKPRRNAYAKRFKEVSSINDVKRATVLRPPFSSFFFSLKKKKKLKVVVDEMKRDWAMTWWRTITLWLSAARVGVLKTDSDDDTCQQVELQVNT
jgi:hypothetical protein